MKIEQTWSPLTAQQISDAIEVNVNFPVLFDFTVMRVVSVGWSDHKSYVILRLISGEAEPRKINLGSDNKVYQVNGLTRAYSAEFRSIYNECCEVLYPFDEETEILRVHVARWLIGQWQYSLENVADHEMVNLIFNETYDFHGLFYDCPRSACEMIGVADDIDADLEKLYGQ